jgi:hypothetical protein
MEGLSPSMKHKLGDKFAKVGYYDPSKTTKVVMVKLCYKKERFRYGASSLKLKLENICMASRT